MTNKTVYSIVKPPKIVNIVEIENNLSNSIQVTISWVGTGKYSSDTASFGETVFGNSNVTINPKTQFPELYSYNIFSINIQTDNNGSITNTAQLTLPFKMNTVKLIVNNNFDITTVVSSSIF